MLTWLAVSEVVWSNPPGMIKSSESDGNSRVSRFSITTRGDESCALAGWLGCNSGVRIRAIARERAAKRRVFNFFDFVKICTVGIDPSKNKRGRHLTE